MLGTADQTRSLRDRRTHQRLLLGGAAAGLTTFVAAFLVEGATRPGYSPWRHAVSQLSLGPFGWVNTIAILLTALALLAFAAGLRSALPTGVGSIWGPRLIGVAGVGFLLAAAFPIDPGLGYPPGVSDQHSLAGLVHGLVITVAFGCLSAACFVIARRFAGDPAWRGWAHYSTVTGLVVAAGYLATSVLTGLDQAGMLPNAPGGVVQRAMIVAGFGWVVLVAVRLLRQQQPAATSLSTRNPSAAARILLSAGIAAGPVYVLIGLVEAFTRSGFDLTRHSLSLLTNGDLGWIHMAMLVTTGLLTIAGAVGLQRSLTDGLGRGWGPILVGIYGAGLVAAGLLTADPAQGFPPGTPAGPPTTISWHGLGHLVAGGIGFLCLIAGCFVFARRFTSQGEHGWAVYSTVTGVAFLAGFAGIASGNQAGWLNLAFGAAVVTAWVWVSAVCVRAGAQLRRPDGRFPTINPTVQEL